MVKHFQPRKYEFPEFEDTFRALLRGAEAAADLSKHAPVQRKQLTNGSKKARFGHSPVCTKLRLGSEGQETVLASSCNATPRTAAHLQTGMTSCCDIASRLPGLHAKSFLKVSCNAARACRLNCKRQSVFDGLVDAMGQAAREHASSSCAAHRLTYHVKLAWPLQREAGKMKIYRM